MSNLYVHGTDVKEQNRLANLNFLTNESFINYMGISDGMTICDFGCGLGNLIDEISVKYNNCQIVGMEISKDQYDVAVKNSEESGKIKLFNTDVLNNNLPDNSFDITYCRYLLEHVQNPVNVVKEMIRVTKPGGKIISQENDLHNVIYFPDFEGHRDLIKSFCDLQILMGGDPYIGRKLFDFYYAAGIENIKLSYGPEIYTEEEPEKYKAWISNSINILLGAKEGLIKNKLVEEKHFDKVIDQMNKRVECPNGVALFHWNRVTAVK